MFRRHCILYTLWVCEKQPQQNQANFHSIHTTQGRYNVLKTEGAIKKLGGQKPPKDPIFDGFESIFWEGR